MVAPRCSKRSVHAVLLAAVLLSYLRCATLSPRTIHDEPPSPETLSHWTPEDEPPTPDVVLPPTPRPTAPPKSFWRPRAPPKAKPTAKPTPRPAAAGPPKGARLAFCFLIRRNINQLDLWLDFFAGHEDKYEVYIHVADGEGSDQPFVLEHAIPERAVTSWGGDLYSAVDLVYGNALNRSSANYKFILLSESHIPVRSFDYVYAQLAGSPKSRIFYNKRLPDVPSNKNDRGTRHMMLGRFINNFKRSEDFADHIDVAHWYFNEMWTVLNRKHTALLTGETDVREHLTHAFAWDENYPTYVLSLHGLLETEVEIASTTFVNWNERVVRGPGRFSPKEYDKISEHDFFTLAQLGPQTVFARKFAPTSDIRHYRDALWNRPADPVAVERNYSSGRMLRGRNKRRPH